ncbi:HAD-IA family hydrolase [Nocardioides marmotae]|uniref:HAD-IA family hydrolase n=1 Tax=Nocardioides marmotae TaxID=2663857 RepID=UPI001324DA1E|nr:HAD-IA family hydrolase [Nocardioides marmotae]MBC9734951.1 HAD-IA family hydrolase [Nocardioides marmotae]MTB86050.1 HAD-IA family hydrolase [Nocardioides marmotae]
MIVTFDLFSALTDSRTGASRVLAELATERGWPQSGEELYDRWDGHNKALQRTAAAPTTFHDLSREALARAWAELGHDQGYVDADTARLEDSVGEWPLWPDVAAGVAAVARDHRVGLLSNVDDDLARRTRAHALVDPALVLTSQRLGAYKPTREIYARAAAEAAPDRLVHVAASARDVRGAIEAGLPTVRLVRPGHVVDATGPRPPVEVTDAAALAEAVARV